MITGRIAFAGKTIGDVRLALGQAVASLENGHEDVRDGDDDHAYHLISRGQGNAFSDLDAMRVLPQANPAG
jgi:ethanolamine utilization microcompartment shell protein EutL